MTPRVKMAWELAFRDENFRIVFADIIARTGIYSPTSNPEARVLQQFGIELMGVADLYSTKGSFPLDNINLLTGRSGRKPSTKWSRFWGRLLPRRRR